MTITTHYITITEYCTFAGKCGGRTKKTQLIIYARHLHAVILSPEISMLLVGLDTAFKLLFVLAEWQISKRKDHNRPSLLRRKVFIFHNFFSFFFFKFRLTSLFRSFIKIFYKKGSLFTTNSLLTNEFVANWKSYRQ